MLRVIVRISLMAAIAGALGACAPLPTEPTVETVDERTGITVARIARPVELVSDGRGSLGDPFAFLAPFETNRMGARTLYLWTAVPQGAAEGSAPVWMVDGEPLPLTQTGVTLDALGLSHAPYALPTPWSVERLYGIDRALLERLARAGRLDLVVPGPEGSEQRYTAAAVALAPLLEFVARTAD